MRSHFEFASSVWCPYKLKHIEKIKKVWRRAAKLIPGLREMLHEERMRKLCLPTLVYRRHRGDMIEVCKLVHGIHDNMAEPVIHSWYYRHELRGNSLKLFPRMFFVFVFWERRKNFFNILCC